jgi:alginate production protein
MAIRLLTPGLRVAVKGQWMPDGMFLAREVEIRRENDDDEELRGLIDTVDPASGTFTLLGFLVRTEAETPVTRETGRPASLGDLEPGMRVKVDGRRQDDATFVAERIRIRADQGYVERKIVGPIETVHPATDDGAVLRLVGRNVLVDRRTEIVGGAMASPMVRRRLRITDDDDLQFVGGNRIGRNLALAGEIRLKSEVFDNEDLDEDGGEREVVPEVFGILGLAARWGPLFAYAEVTAEREFVLDSEDSFAEGNSDVRLSEVYFEVRGVGDPRISIAFGRQKFDEEREWHYDTKDLDAVRLLADFRPVSVDASISRNLFNQSRNVREQETTNVIVNARYSFKTDMALEGYRVDRQDRTPLNDSPRILGLRLIGRPGPFEMWFDLAREGGERGRLDPLTGNVVVRPIDAHALDAGLVYRPRWRLDPTFVVSYALASGEGDDVLDLDPEDQAVADDGTFRQSGLQRNRGKFNGVVSFRYYGEVLDPELTNLGVLSMGVGLRPLRAFSLDLLYHHYEQDESSRVNYEFDVDGDPLGLDPDIGDELDLILGYEPSRRFELRFTAGRFRPGRAFDEDAGPAGVARFQAKFRF